MSRKTDDDSDDWLGQSGAMPELGDTIKALREAAGLSQDQLAESVGVSRAAISSWENNEHEPRKKHVRALARTFNMTPLQLMSGPPKPARPTGSLIAVESDGSELRVMDLVSVRPVLWAKTRRRLIVVEDKQGDRLALLATDETIQALESCLLTLRELL